VTINAFMEEPVRLAEIPFTTTHCGNVTKLAVQKKADVVLPWLSTEVPVVRQHRRDSEPLQFR
jgi:hypothetical protein